MVDTKEPSTGIVFPQECNGMNFLGCGVRIKWGLVKVYAVAAYMDTNSMKGLGIKGKSNDNILKTLMDPSLPRVIRIVMNRGLSIEKYTSVIVESLTPRMNGQDLDKLEQFKKMNPATDLTEGSVMEMTIHGDKFTYRNSVGLVNELTSGIFTRALCDVYFGADPASPTLKNSVIEGAAQL
jgi:hypothetical protein